jgi:hypothetical protein
MFPFKFELKEIMDDYLDQKFGKTGENRKANRLRTAAHLFTMYLCYLDYEKKEDVIKVVEQLGKEYYKISPRKDQLEYLKSLSTVIYTKEMYDEEEYKLFDLTGIQIDRATDILDAHSFILKGALKHPVLKSVVPKYLSNASNYRFWYSVIASRAYRVGLVEYERIFNMKIGKAPGGKQHLEILTEILQGNFFFFNF